MARNKSLTPKTRAAMRAAVAERWLKGWTDRRIGADVGISEEGAAYWRRKLEREAQHAVTDRTARIAEQAATLRYIRTEALDAWERSKATIQRKTTETVKDGEPRVGPAGAASGRQRLRAQIMSEETAGAAVFLAQARGALADERELLGLDAPTKATLSGPDGGPVQVAVGPSDELLARLRLLSGADFEEEVARLRAMAAETRAPRVRLLPAGTPEGSYSPTG